MNLVLSSDSKPRLKWTPELHQRFVEAINQLGGPEKATPKSLMRLMGIPGLTLYHLKSHLQKFRLGKTELPENLYDYNEEDYNSIEGIDGHYNKETNHGIQSQMNETLQIAHALQIQMEVQRELHEQIEVQRHLQLRIEAQGKYLQTVLKKAQETLARYNSSSMGVENARAELSQLLSSMVNNSSCPCSSFSELTEIGISTSMVDLESKQKRNTICSMESSLTSSESSGRKEEKQPTSIDLEKSNTSTSVFELPLIDVNEEYKSWNNVKKRNGSSAFSDHCYCVEQPIPKRSTIDRDESNNYLRKMPDLNAQYQNDID